MVSLATSHVRQFTERFFLQSGLLRFGVITTSCMSKFFILRIKGKQLPTQKKPKQLHRNTLFYKMIKYRADVLNYDIGGEKMNRDEYISSD